jgi:alkylhydroperoxidase family enzyme
MSAGACLPGWTVAPGTDTPKTGEDKTMARVPYLDLDDLAPEDHDVLRRPRLIYRALANSPGGCRAFLVLADYIRWQSPLDARLRELAILQVGWLAREPYEWAHHVKIAYDFGVSDADIEGLIAESEGRNSNLDPLAKLVLRGTREMTETLTISDETYAALEADLPRDHLIDLCLVISFYCGVVRVLGTLQIDVDPDFQPYLDRHPLPAQ